MRDFVRERLMVPLAVLTLVAWGGPALGQETLAVLGPGPAIPSGVLPAPSVRWQASLDAFAAADRARAPTAGGVVFVGSSSIRLWENLEEQFDQFQTVTKRGFGGSWMSDSAQHVNRLVIPYRPRLVVVYAGENDLAEGRSPEHVLASFREFVERVREAVPGARIAYVSIKPSPRRAALIPVFRETNTLIARYAETVPGVDYIDVFSRMLAPDGAPRRELFRDDALHLNRDGYALWYSIISEQLR